MIYALEVRPGDTLAAPGGKGRFESDPNASLVWRFTTQHLPSIRRLIDRYHYSHRSRSCPVFYAGLMAIVPHKPPKICAGIVFTMATARMWTGKAWELQRLVRHPAFHPPLTKLISKSVRAIKHLPKPPNVLVSYADSGQGHHGGIYQAANWHFHAKRKRSMDGLIVNGTFVPGRSCNSKWGTRSPKKLALLHPDFQIEAHYDEGKYLYWLPIQTNGQELHLQKNPYPKPDWVGSENER